MEAKKQILEMPFGLPPLSAAEAVLTAPVDCGPGLADDTAGETLTDSALVLAAPVTKEEFCAYCSALAAPEYRLLWSREIEGNRFVLFEAGETQLYLAYTPCNRRMTVVHDRSTNARIPDNDLPFAGAELYQYSLEYSMDNSNGETAMNCGMMYILRFPDGSLFVIDGGHRNQSWREPLEGVWRFLCGLSGGERVRVRAWFLTHAHGDHNYMVGRLMEQYHDWLDIDCFLFNYPAVAVNPRRYDAESTSYFKAMAAKYCPTAGIVKLHSGAALWLFGCLFEVLYTQEDLPDDDGVYRVNDFNDTSAVLKVTAGKHTVLFPADICQKAEARICAMYSAATLHCDFVQAAHHLINRLPDFYRAVSATYVLAPQSAETVGISERHATNLGDAICATDADHVLFAGHDTWKITFASDGHGLELTPLPHYDRMQSVSGGKT